MSTVQSIEHAISAWDDQIAADLAAGRLDALISEARADIAAGNTRPLNEVLN